MERLWMIPPLLLGIRAISTHGIIWLRAASEVDCTVAAIELEPLALITPLHSICDACMSIVET